MYNIARRTTFRYLRRLSTRNFSEIRYAKSHEWFRATDGGVGISDHAQESLGEIVYVDLPQVGDSFGLGETFANVESVKAASEVYMPVAGEIVEVNSSLVDSPEKINESAEADGWFVKIKPSSSDSSHLLDLAAYEAECAKAE